MRRQGRRLLTRQAGLGGGRVQRERAEHCQQQKRGGPGRLSLNLIRPLRSLRLQVQETGRLQFVLSLE